MVIAETRPFFEKSHGLAPIPMAEGLSKAIVSHCSTCTPAKWKQWVQATPGPYADEEAHWATGGVIAGDGQDGDLDLDFGEGEG